MADWRQIQARIRKAKNSSDPHAKLTDLYQRTRDAMVAWELGCFEEKAGHGDEAAKWYVTAHSRFRRTDWKKKAEEALARLGVEVPVSASAPEHPEQAEPHTSEGSQIEAVVSSAGGNESEVPDEEVVAAGTTGSQPVTQNGQPLEGQQQKKKRRRGRRGGRGRGRKTTTAAPGLPSSAFAPVPNPANSAAESRPERAPFTPPTRPERTSPEPFIERRRLPEPSVQPAEPARLTPPLPFAAPQLPSERMVHGRSDPGLASRLAHLESMLRRLVSSPLHRLDEADEAPAGPGVFLLSESDQSTSYYIESCQTLRVGLANLTRGSGGRTVRGGRGGHGESSLKSRLADYLGINEAKVIQYMKDHCAVRWIQLDDEAPYLAQFAIGVLRAPLNFE